jgi:hypothetical protein
MAATKEFEAKHPKPAEREPGEDDDVFDQRDADRDAKKREANKPKPRKTPSPRPRPHSR